MDTEHINITSVYKPLFASFIWLQTHEIGTKAGLIIGDFNNHSTNWGYNETDSDSEAVESWAMAHDLTMLHDATDDFSFQSSRWRRGYNPT